MMESQEEYVKSLKQIKEAEERVQQEVEARRKVVQEELRNLEASAAQSVEAARNEGERMVEMEVDQARQKAEKEAEKILDDAKTKAVNVSSTQTDTKTIRAIIEEVLLSHL